ncbi:asparagine synthase (glutamine-hydrolyzing) [Sulfurimonas sp. HSL-1716]|uniref:asparagine synthase (glutamine-hydrolyzing) n=1 Tax=Hydrocurvibacter sulfurireducens TaxID=3131937 RepID=UPI0031F72E7E
MCAIFGIIGEYEEQKARYALSLMQHRGPDFCGVVQENDLFFAHNLLSIMDTSATARQPLRHKDIIVSFNGEIYNFLELKRELEFEYQSSGDSEVLMAAYLRWGVDFVRHIRGMFAIAIKDGDTLYLFRDRFGKKPLYYHQGKSFVFASEIKALVPFLKHRSLDNDALLSYLSFLAPTPPHTFFKGIQKLAAGEYLTYRHNRIEIKRYYDILNVKPDLISNEDTALKLIEKSLFDSISIRLNSSVPAASLLSGGIDSAFIAAIAKKRGHLLHTFTLGYDEYRNYDERKNAAVTAEFLGVRNSVVEIDKNRFIEASDRVFDTLDEPLNDPAAIPLYLLFEEIEKEGYRVVMSGEGSDELFLGYRQYFEYLDIQKASGLMHKNWLKKYFRSNFSMNREWEWYKRIWEDTLLFRTSGEKFTDLQKNELLRQNIRDNESLKYLKPYRDRFESSLHTDESTWYSYVDLNIFQAEHFLRKLDHVSMAHSIESRTPFLDHHLAENIFGLAPSLRYKDGITKSILKKIASPYLNEEILKRKKKGFSNPYMEWLMASGRISLIKEVNEQTGMFKKEVLEKYIERAERGRFKQHVWGLYVLSWWIKKNLL